MLTGLSPDKNVPFSSTLDEYLLTSQFGLSSEMQEDSVHKETRLQTAQLEGTIDDSS